jgi:RNase P/RNase MRP subunit p30
MRKFIDFNLKMTGKNSKGGNMIDFASDLGFYGVAAIFNRRQNELITNLSRRGCLDIATRLDITPKNQADLRSKLKKMRRRFEVIAVNCNTKAIARQAAKDNRIDVLNFPKAVSRRRHVKFDRKEASLSSEANGAYEINFSELFNQNPVVVYKIFSIIKEEVENAVRCDVPIIISSGATSTAQMRRPRELSSLSVLFDLQEEEGLDAVSTTPARMIDTNRKKLESEFISPGVRVVKHAC